MENLALFIRGYENVMEKIGNDLEELMLSAIEVCAELPENKRKVFIETCAEIDDKVVGKYLETAQTRAKELGLL